MAKVSLYIGDETWKRFREQVFSRYGTLRRLSEEAEALISSEDMETILRGSSKKIGISIERELTPYAVKRNRPKLRGPTAESILRQVRDRGHGGRVPRH